MNVLEEQLFGIDEVMPSLTQINKAFVVGQKRVKRSSILGYLAKCSSLDCVSCGAKPLHFIRSYVQVKHARLPPSRYYMVRMEYDKIDETAWTQKYRYATIDHIIPLSKTGDKSSPANKQLMCNVCNKQKTNILHLTPPNHSVDPYKLMTYETYLRWYLKVFYGTQSNPFNWTANSKPFFDAGKKAFGAEFDLYHFDIAYEKILKRFRLETLQMSKSKKRLFRQKGLAQWFDDFSPNDFVVFCE